MTLVVSRNVFSTRDLALEIFSYLTPAELAVSGRVNSEWRQLASHNVVWEEYGRKQFGQYLDVPSVKDFLKEYHLQQLKSNDEIVDRIQDFANRVPLGQNGRFRCIIGSGRGHRVISVEIKGNRKPLHPVEGSPRDHEDDIRKFDIKGTAYASHSIGRGDLMNPEPVETRWIEGPIFQRTYHASGEITTSTTPGYGTDDWGKRLGRSEKILNYTKEPFRAVLRIPYPLLNETDLATWHHFSHLENGTQMQQKIQNILKGKIISLKEQNSREQNKRILVVGVLGILLLGCLARLYLNSSRW